jgi:hypothetical protein
MVKACHRPWDTSDAEHLRFGGFRALFCGQSGDKMVIFDCYPEGFSKYPDVKYPDVKSNLIK